MKAGEPEFAELDAKYLAGCKNPLVKSAVPEDEVACRSPAAQRPISDGALSIIQSAQHQANARMIALQVPTARRAIRVGFSGAAPRQWPPAPAKPLPQSKDARPRKTGSAAAWARQRSC